MRSQPALLLLAAALLAGAPLAAQPALTGPEISIDPRTSASDVATAADSMGGLLVAWSDGVSLYTRAFTASGAPLGPSFPLGIEGQVPSLAADAPDGFLLAWTEVVRTDQVETRRIFVRRLDPAGRPRGGAIPVQGAFRVAANVVAIEPVRIAAAADGSFVVAWNRSGDVRIRRFDAAGRPRGEAALLPREPDDAGERFALALAVLDDGATRIAWSSWRSPSDVPHLRVRRFDRDGSPLSAPVHVLSASASAYVVGIAFGPDGGFLAGWTSWLDERPSDLHLRAFDPAGRPLAEQQVEGAGIRFLLAAEPGGTFLAAWSGGASFCAASGLQLDRGGSFMGPAGCLTRPSIGEEASLWATGTVPGGFALLWSQLKRSGPEDFPYFPRLFLQRLATAEPGTFEIEQARAAVLESVREPFALRILRKDGTAGTVSVDVRLSGAVTGGATLTFPDGDSTPRAVLIPLANDNVRGNDRTVRVALGRPTGGAVLGLPRRAAVEIRDDDEPSPLLARAGRLLPVAAGNRDTELSEPAAGVSGAGGFEVVWGYSYRHRYTDPVQYDYALRGKLFDADGKPRDAFNRDRPAWPGAVRLAVHPAGDFVVFWQEWKDLLHRPESLARRFDAHGAAAGPVLSLNLLADSVAPLPGGRFVAVSRGHDQIGGGLFASLLSGDSLASEPPVLVTRDPLEPGSLPVVAANGSGRFIVAWAAAPTGDGPGGIFVRRFDASGSPLGPPVRASTGAGHDFAATLSANDEGSFAVAWERNWDGRGAGIYARTFDAAGAPRGPEIPVNSDTEGDERDPSVALAGDGRFLVLWQSLAGISGQLYTVTGARLGSEALVAPGGTPTAAWSDRGFFVVLHNGEDIIARRLPL